MNSFPGSQTTPASPKSRGIIGISVPAIFIFCAVIGLAVAGWRIANRLETERSKARLEAETKAAGIQLQFDQATTAAEVLGAAVKQSGGALPNFQKIAAEIIDAHPGLASLELQPGGIVRDIYPKQGRERAVGLNVLTDPIQRSGANLALQKRTLTATGPFALYNGDPGGIMVRMPIFLRGRDGREVCWGFVGASMRLSEALAKARIDELWNHGYEYIFYAPASGSQKPAVIISHGLASAQDAVQQSVTVQDVELKLGVQPRGGWINKTRAAAEILAVLIFSALLSMLIHVVRSRREVELALAEQSRRLTRESTDRNQLQEDCMAAKRDLAAAHTDVAQLRSALDSATSKISGLQLHFESELRAAKQSEEAAQEKLKHAEARARELQARLDTFIEAADRAVKANQAEVDRLRTASQQAQETIQQLQTRLETEKETADEGAKAAASRLKKAETAIADLQAHLDAAARTMKQAAEANTAKTTELETTIRELTERLAKARDTEAQLAKLSEQLQEAEEKLRRKKSAPEKPVSVSEPEPVKPASSPEPGTSLDLLAADPSPKLEPAISEPLPPEKPAVSTDAAENPGPASEPTAPEKPKRKKTRRDVTLDLFPDEPVIPAFVKPAAPAPIATMPAPVQPEPVKTAPESPKPAQIEPLPEKDAHPEPVEPKDVVPSSVPGNLNPAPDAPKEEIGDALEFHQIEELDTTETMARAQKNAGQSAKALKHFIDHESQSPEQIRDALVRGDTSAAERILKTLISGAGEVDASDVQAAGAALLKAIQNQSDPTEIEFLWADLHKAVQELVGSVKSVAKAKDDKPASVRAQKPAQPANPAQLRKALHQILPLLAGEDPGAQDCFQDNREIFRPGFPPENFEEFEQAIKKGRFTEAVEHLRKAAKKNGVSL